MKHALFVHVLFALMLTANTASASEEMSDIHTVFMRSTFKVVGKASGRNKSAQGTAFILAKPSATDPHKAYFVLVTAGHVLKNMVGDEAVLFLRKKIGDTYQRMLYPITIRKSGRPLWVDHPEADVAVMYISLPTEADVIPVATSLLATDEMLKQFSVHPGDRLSCLGFPRGIEANDAGFPILRSGQIASYPLVPTKSVGAFIFDFNVFEGNSGGPVYLSDSNRIYGGTTNMGTVQFLVGLVSEQAAYSEEIKMGRNTLTLPRQLGLAIVIHASLIRETLDMLPQPEGE
ncbi:MAG: trypsin-like peptidase domain-containing protein [Nitrosomonadales bacterium]|nr:trypsin-like peptidase domain-containing protein [Nitrosomonadales bacterium]